MGVSRPEVRILGERAVAESDRTPEPVLATANAKAPAGLKPLDVPPFFEIQLLRKIDWNPSKRPHLSFEYVASSDKTPHGLSGAAANVRARWRQALTWQTLTARRTLRTGRKFREFCRRRERRASPQWFLR